MEADLARARALVQGTTGKDAIELRAALERARAALESGATVEDALAEMDKASTARNDAQSTLAGPNGDQPAAAEELVTVLESTFEPELFDPYNTLAALGPGGKPLHDRLTELCSTRWFGWLIISSLLVFCVTHDLWLCGLAGPFPALTLTSWTLFVACFAVMNLLSSLRCVVEIRMACSASLTMTVATLRIMRGALASYDCIYFILLLATVLPLTQQWPTRGQAAFWTVMWVILSAVYLNDAVPMRRLVAALCGIGSAAMCIAFVLTWLDLHQVALAEEVPFLGGRVSSRNRLLGTEVFAIITYIRFAVRAYRHPNRFVTIPNVELCSVSRAEAFALLRVRQGHGSSRTGRKVTPSPGLSDADATLKQVGVALRNAAVLCRPDSRSVIASELTRMRVADLPGGNTRPTQEIAAELRQHSALDGSTVAIFVPVAGEKPSSTRATRWVPLSKPTHWAPSRLSRCWYSVHRGRSLSRSPSHRCWVRFRLGPRSRSHRSRRSRAHCDCCKGAP